MRSIASWCIVIPLASACLAGLGCGDDAEAPASSATSASSSGAGGSVPTVTPAPPLPPAPPVFTPCPAGWREVTDGDLVVCEPWPEGGQAACTGAEAHFPGEPGCSPVGSACPAGSWSDAIPANADVVYVLAGAAAPGDGSQAAPFPTIADALAVAADGAVIAVGEGTYDEIVEIDTSVTLWGACPELTRVASSEPSDGVNGATIVVFGGDAGVRNLSIGGERVGITALNAGTSAAVEGVLFDAVRAAGMLAYDGASLTAMSIAVRETRPTPGSPDGRGVAAIGGSAMTIQRAVVEKNHDLAVYAQDPGTVLSLSDVAVTDSLSSASAAHYATAVFASFDATIELSRVVVERSREAALTSDSAVVHAVDVVVRDTLPAESNGVYGDGAWVQQKGVFEASRLRIENSYQYGVWGVVDSRVTLEDVLIKETRSQTNDDGQGYAVAVSASSATVRRGRFEASRIATLSAADGSTMLVEDVHVVDTRSSDGSHQFGRAVQVSGASSFEAHRVVLEKSRDTGLLALQGSTVVASDIAIRDNAGEDIFHTLGRCLEIETGSQAHVERALLERCREVAFGVFGEGTSVEATDVSIVDALERACAVDACSDSPAGFGVVTNVGAALHLTDFTVTRAALAGVVVGPTGALNLANGVVSENPIGANVQAEGYDLTRLTTGVAYVDNGVNLDASSLPIPDGALE